MTNTSSGTAVVPPRWFIRSAWAVHRGLLRATRDRVGLSRPTPGGRFGMLRLRTVGRRSGQERAVVLGYVEDGDRLVTLAMNGWDPAEPAWWLNLQAHPEASVDLTDGSRRVRAREATGDERERLWGAVRGHSGYGNLDALATRRGRPTAVVVLEPWSDGHQA
ncbi:MAG: nitroreductase family deazaflavin-dependent oxidoreductase [Coriobacteriales bacterium]|nr:nitroreductase family deazaflavin-dependent oxidoreductase [Coriobacteriales bacterium]